MALFGLFGNKKEKLGEPLDLRFLKADMHSHLIPGIDDGSASMADSIEMLAKFQSLGYEKVITTPHVMSDYYRNTSEIILKGLDEVRNEAVKQGLTIAIDAAAEYYYDDDLIKKLKQREPLLTFGDRYLLFEFSFHSPPGQTEELLFEMMTQGYRPVLAHFERYSFYAGDLEQAKSYREMGVNIQLNFNSLGGHYGPYVQKMAEELVEAKLIDFVATDCHRIDHLVLLEENLKRPVFQKLKDLTLKNHELI